MVRGVLPPSTPAAPPARQGLAFSIADAPCLADRTASQDRLTGWLSDIARTAAGKSLRQLAAEAPKVEAVLLGLADGSPYLWELATPEPDRLLRLLTAEPDGHLSALLAKSAKSVAGAKDEAAAMQLLRRMKAETELLIALADVGG